jgi:hypothetical protein
MGFRWSQVQILSPRPVKRKPDLNLPVGLSPFLVRNVPKCAKVPGVEGRKEAYRSEASDDRADSDQSGMPSLIWGARVLWSRLFGSLANHSPLDNVSNLQRKESCAIF